jgi:dynein heavy chain
VVPVVNCKAVIVTDKEDKTVYYCPVYKTIDRMMTYVFPA